MKLQHWRQQILCAILVVNVLACQFIPLKQTQITTAEHSYSIDTATLLPSLEQGRTDVFTLLPDDYHSMPDLEYIPVMWKQGDYLLIAQAFHQVVQHESLDGWNLNEMFFRLDCKEVSTGWQLGGFTFSKIIQEQKMSRRAARNITIDPAKNMILFTEDEYYPVGYFTGMVEWASIDLAQMKISAEDAIHIAESAGGERIRTDAENKCDIFQRFVVEGPGYQNDWVITYSGHDEQFTTLLIVLVDGRTGKYKVVHLYQAGEK